MVLDAFAGGLGGSLRLRSAGRAVVGCVSFADCQFRGHHGAGGGTTDDLAALEELPWNSVSMFLDADDTVRLTIFGNTARGLRTCFSFKPLHVSPEAWPRTLTLAGVTSR